MTTRNVDARRLNVKGLLIAIGLPVVLVGALVATLLGTGAFSRENQGEDASLWLWTTPAGELARVNGLTAATDVRFELEDAAGNAVQVEQTDSHLMLREIATGKVSAIDLSTLELTGEAETAPGEGVRLALADEGAFIIDQTQGLVNQVDPSTLTAIGDPLQFPAGLTGGAFDAAGKLWIGVPREGTIVQIEPRESGAKALGTEVVAEPRQELALTVLGDGVAVLNSTVKKMTTIRSDGRRSETDIELAGPAETADTSPGTIASVTVTDPPSVVTVNDDQTRTFDIAAGASNLLGASVEFHQRIYVPDGASGLVWVYDLDGNELDRIEIDSGNGPVELYHTGDTLFANAVNTNAAVVVSSDGNARQADKDRDDILGGDAPPEDETGGDEGDEDGNDESAPEIGPPGAVTNLDGTVGDGLINLSWDAAPNNGSALTKYVVEGAGETWEISPSQRVLEIGDLDNGSPYTFTVTAHNAEGAGDTVTSPSITPSADVPDPVGAVEATANPDGTVTVKWDEADGQGNDVSGYQVESVSGNGERTVAGQSDGTELVVPAGSLEYGVQYAFQVTTLSGAAASAPSPLSASVVPFNVPNAPGDLIAQTSGSAAGTIDVAWSQPSNNGRDIQKYIVRAGTQTVEVPSGTTASLSGFGNNEQVSVSVTAVNEAGESEPAQTTSNTMSAPTVQIQNHESLANQINLTLAIDDGGSSDAQCTLLSDGVNEQTGSCPDVFAVTGLYASTGYSFQIRISNPAGEATSSTYNASTKAINGKVYFRCDEGYDTPSGYCDSVDGVSVYSQPSQSGNSIGTTNTPTSYKAYCWTTGDASIPPRGTESGQEVDYHPGKDASNKWVKIDYASNAYIPFVWFNIDGVGKNSTGDLPEC
ncbi:fibronectin type III domain-containing protein [Glycomyces harbinensis]|uniref:Fibronectin type III domain-containing protein n=1 Tax=Glycomyces harbinensis TaxID=58114 RepID=A0A1G7C8M7_9ACTN|nr:fibronectin type III domain-containing protein [Glycomyces harbinensis]SDE35669.1 Fibronectin type III domain-containing protein [Glycomyces harbinensis]